MLIFVKSRGPVRDKHEYTWIGENRNSEKPSILADDFQVFSGDGEPHRIADLHDTDHFSVIVLRDKEGLLLLLTGIQAQWTAVGNIYHSVAWLSSQPHDEQNIRRLIIRALQGDLQSDISSAITSLSEEDKLGFDVNFDRLKELEKDNNLAVKNNKVNNSEIIKIGKNIPELKKSLQDELTSNCLPQENGFLIVVSDFVAEGLLRKLEVWRSLSSRVESKVWKEFKKKLPVLNGGKDPTYRSAPSPDIRQGKVIVFLAGLLLGIGLGIMLGIFINTIHPKEIPSTPPTHETQLEKLEQPKAQIPSKNETQPGKLEQPEARSQVKS